MKTARICLQLSHVKLTTFDFTEFSEEKKRNILSSVFQVHQGN
jgi:hypothetical protein